MLAAVRRGQRLDRALAASDPNVEPAAVRRLSEGVVRLRGRLDGLIGAFTTRGLGSIEARLLDVLRVGAYEILEEPETPNYAAVSEAVDAARGLLGAGPARFANAVLRNLARSGPELDCFPDSTEDPVGHLSTWGSHPRWLVERWIRHFGLAATRELVELNNRPAPLYLRPVLRTNEETAGALSDIGVDSRPAHPALSSLELPAVDRLVSVLEKSGGIIQDPAATAVTCFLELPSGTALDLCAAPGGKAVGLWLAGAQMVIAADRSPSRLNRVRETALRLAAPIACVAADASRPPFSGSATVLLDAPCTGTGTLRRNPDARWRVDAGALTALIAVQQRLLEGAATVTVPGGLLVYSTCSLEPEENAQQVERFLARRPDFSLEREERLPDEFRDPEGSLQVLPHRSGFDGSYAARLRRTF